MREDDIKQTARFNWSQITKHWISWKYLEEAYVLYSELEKPAITKNIKIKIAFLFQDKVFFNELQTVILS